MLNKEQYDELENCGLDGLPLEHCGARLDLTREEFFEVYSTDIKARKCYELGQSAAAQAMIIQITKSSITDWKAKEYLATNIFNLKTDPKKKEIEIKKEDKKESNWFDDNLDIDD